MTTTPSAHERWEAAYRRFETPAQERAKFRSRLRSLGVEQWPRDCSIVEVFCGRGNGLHAWSELGFHNLEGLDLSERLAREYDGPAHVHVADARELPFDDASRDVLCVQGGLHHLNLPHDLQQTIREMHRVLKPTGKVVMVEPWRTPFLTAAHLASENFLLRRLWGKLDALAEMTELERDTYEDWLRQPRDILALLREYFEPNVLRIGWGKLNLVGTPRSSADKLRRSAACIMR